MTQSLVPPSRVDRLAYFLRRWQGVHRVGRWLRRTLWSAALDGFWECARSLFANSAKYGPPATTYSVYQALRCGWPKLNGRIVLHDQGAPAVTSGSLLARSGLYQYSDQPWPIFWSEHANATLVTESLAYLMPGKTLCVESAYGQKFWRTDSASRFLTLPPKIKLAENWTSIVSQWTPTPGVPVYGHWLHDALPRLALLPEFPSDTKIIVPPNLAPYQKESLQLLGVWDRCRPTSETHVEVERYFFSSTVGMIGCYNPYIVNFLRTAFLPKRDPVYVGPRKFFFQRTSKHRPVANNEEICDFFRNRGWTVVRDKELTFAQTVKLFSEAEAVCSVLGSNMCNVLFCPPGCVVMHLSPDVFLDGFVDWIAQVANLNYHFAVIPVGGPYSPQVRIEPKLIQEFFESAHISF